MNGIVRRSFISLLSVSLFFLQTARVESKKFKSNVVKYKVSDSDVEKYEGSKSDKDESKYNFRIFNDTGKIIALVAHYSKVHETGGKIGVGLAGVGLTVGGVLGAAAAGTATAGAGLAGAAAVGGIAIGEGVDLIRKSFGKFENGFSFAMKPGEVYKGKGRKAHYDIHDMEVSLLKKDQLGEIKPYNIHSQDHFEIRDKKGEKIIIKETPETKKNEKIDIKYHWAGQAKKTTDIHIELEEKEGEDGTFKIWATVPYVIK